MATSFSRESKPNTSFTKETKPGLSTGFDFAVFDVDVFDDDTGFFDKETKPTTSFTKEIKP